MGLGWSPAQRYQFETTTDNFTLDSCILKLTFRCNDLDPLVLFPRSDNDPTLARKKEQFLELAMFNRTDVLFQMITVECDFNLCHYNFFSQQYSKVNTV